MQWEVDAVKRVVYLVVSANNAMVVRAVIVFADQLFQGEDPEPLPQTPKP